MKIIQQQGFTLIELLVTIGIVAILANMAAPAYSSMILNQNLNKSARELVLVLNEAKAKATLERRQIKVVLDSSIANTKTQFNWKPAGKAVLKADSVKDITFLPTGLTNKTTSVVFEVCAQKENSKRSKIVTISRMGNIELIKEGTC